MSERKKTDKAAHEHNGRDSNGRFAKGNPGGPGNPYGRKVAQLHRAALAAVREEDLYEIFQTLVIHAKAGRIPAIKLVLAYTLGKPQEAGNPDEVIQEEIRPTPPGPPPDLGDDEEEEEEEEEECEVDLRRLTRGIPLGMLREVFGQAGYLDRPPGGGAGGGRT